MRLVLWRPKSSAADVSTQIASTPDVNSQPASTPNLAGYSLLEKAVRAGLVKKQVLVHPTQGTLFYRDQWVSPNESGSALKPRTPAHDATHTPSMFDGASKAPKPATPEKISVDIRSVLHKPRDASKTSTSLFDEAVPAAQLKPSPVVSRLDEIKRRLTNKDAKPAAPKVATPSLFDASTPEPSLFDASALKPEPVKTESPVDAPKEDTPKEKTPEVKSPSYPCNVGRPAKGMQKVIESLAQKHGVDLSKAGAHLRLEQGDSYMPLVVENIGKNRVSVAHYYKQNGDSIADPDVEFFTAGGEDGKTWVPYAIHQMGGERKTMTLSEDSTGVVSIARSAQADIASFVNMWGRNIKDQGWLDHGTRPGAATETAGESAVSDGQDHIRVDEQHHYEDGKRVRGESVEDETNLEASSPAEQSHHLATWVEKELRAGTKLSSNDLFRKADVFYNGTQANGVYTPKDAYDAVEMAINRMIATDAHFSPAQNASGAERAVKLLKELIAHIPTQSRRTEEMDEYQQFSTVPPLAYVANWVANLSKHDTILEPSAGVGGLAAFAKNVGAKTIVNELSTRRKELLHHIGLFDHVHGENAEQIDNVLPDHLKPNVVIMNPPFSSAAGRMKGARDTSNATRHIEQALARLEPGGRLVAIVGNGMAADRPSFRAWWEKMYRNFDVRANVQVNGAEYAKYGTTWDNQLLVIDKPRAREKQVGLRPLTSRVEKVEDLIPLLEGIRNERVTGIESAAGERGQDTGRSAQPSLITDAGATAGSAAQADSGAGLSGTQRPGVGESDSGGTRATSGSNAGAGLGGRQGTGADGTGRSDGSSGRGAEPDGLKPTAEDDGRDHISVHDEHHYENGHRVRGAAPDEPETARTSLLAEMLGDASTAARVEAAVKAKAQDDWPNNLIKIRMVRGIVAQELGDDHAHRIDAVVEALRADYRAQQSAQQQSNAPQTEAPATTTEAPSSAESASDTSRVEVGHAEAKADGQLTDAVYDTYQPRIVIEGTTMPPIQVQESAAMASVDPIKPTYRPAIPEKYYKPQNGDEEGRLSALAMETVVLAGNSHQAMVPVAYTNDERQAYEKEHGKAPPEQVRRGFFVGDGTGLGKGRQVSGVILDNWMQGRKKAIWVSEKPALINDAKRDLNDVCDMGHKVFDVAKVKLTEGIPHKEGVAFVSYSTLRSKERTPKEGERPASRVEQLIEWFGEDFDGVIAFDEAHAMANNTNQKGNRGVKEASQQAMVGLELQRRLPNARVVYLSATGATEVSNLGYAERLGLWGPGTPFATKTAFIDEVSAGGVAAMELVARDLKALGLYVSRAISWQGVNYEKVEHTLSPQQREIYDTLAEGWQVALSQMQEALKVVGAVSENTGTGNDKVLNTQAKSALLSAFWGAHQRFFNQIITSMKMPSVLAASDEQLKNGKSIVMQLVNTNEAAEKRATDRRRNEAAESGEALDLEDMDLTPRDILMQMVQTSFPVTQQEQYTEESEDGTSRVKSRPALDSQGNPIINKEAVRMREALLDKIGAMAVPDGPLQMIMNHFGHENVAEVTGRTQRIVWGKDEDGNRKRVIQSRSKAHGITEANEFQDGKRRVLVFSNAGGTGRSFHADKRAKNQQQRCHVLVQPGWQAAQAIQGFGRTHRNNQKQPPEYVLATSNVVGEARFISSIARRLDQLGALTKGARKTGSQGFFKSRDNLESEEARAALDGFFTAVINNRVDGLTPDVLEKEMGLKLRDNEGNELQNKPPITQFLNRLLSLKLDTQDKVFKAFSQRLDAIIETKIESGTLDSGMENIHAISTKKMNEQVIHTDPRTGAETRYVQMELTKPNERSEFMEGEGRYMRSRRSGKIYHAGPVSHMTDTKTGALIAQHRLHGITKSQWMAAHKLADPNLWEEVHPVDARKIWKEEHAKTPTTRTETMHFITGAMLPVWDRVKTGDGSMQVRRAQTDDGQRMLGTVIPPKQIQSVLKNFGVTPDGKQNHISATDAVSQIMDGGIAHLSNGWSIRKRRVNGESRIEVTGPNYEHHAELETAGVFHERIEWKTRYFIPMAKADEVVAKLTNGKPIVEMGGLVEKALSDIRAAMPQAPLHLVCMVALPDDLRKALDMGHPATVPHPPVGNRAATPAVHYQGKGQYHYESGGGKRHRAPGARQKPVPQTRTAGTKINAKPPQRGAVSGVPAGVKLPQGQQALSSVRYPSPHEAHEASGPAATKNFSHHEMSLPGDHTLKQKTKDAEEIYAHAGRHKEWLDTRLNRGQGLDKLFGFHVVDGREATPEDYEQAHQKGGMIMLAPLKGQKRFHEKVQGKYRGDASKMRDVSRASVAVRNPDDIAHVTHALRKLGMSYASRPNDRFENPTPAGYGDVQLAPADPHGHIGELQIHALDMLQAKEHGLDGGHSGHKLYERLRQMDEADRDLTPEEKKERERIIEDSQKLYSTATQRMKERPRLVGRPVPEGMGAPTGTGDDVQKGFVRGHFRKAKGMGKKTHPLSSGYFSYDGSLAKMESHAGRPKMWDGKEWKWVKDIGHFDHSAHRISHEEAEEIARDHGVKGAF